jgi:hypothetical protein
VPALLAEGVFVEEIALSVSHDLGGPPRAAGFGEPEGRAMFVPVPEAAVHEDNRAVFRQDDIGFAGGYLFFGPLTVKR